jgi:hypothetical protein
MKISKRSSEAVNLSRTYNAMVKRNEKRTNNELENIT